MGLPNFLVWFSKGIKFRKSMYFVYNTVHKIVYHISYAHMIGYPSQISISKTKPKPNLTSMLRNLRTSSNREY